MAIVSFGVRRDAATHIDQRKKKETYRHTHFHSINFAPVKGARVFVTLCTSKEKHIVQERERERERVTFRRW